jgi:hypothetical protein
MKNVKPSVACACVMQLFTTPVRSCSMKVHEQSMTHSSHALPLSTSSSSSSVFHSYYVQALLLLHQFTNTPAPPHCKCIMHAQYDLSVFLLKAYFLPPFPLSTARLMTSAALSSSVAMAWEPVFLFSTTGTATVTSFSTTLRSLPGALLLLLLVLLLLGLLLVEVVVVVVLDVCPACLACSLASPCLKSLLAACPASSTP